MMKDNKNVSCNNGERLSNFLSNNIAEGNSGKWHDSYTKARTTLKNIGELCLWDLLAEDITKWFVEIVDKMEKPMGLDSVKDLNISSEVLCMIFEVAADIARTLYPGRVFANFIAPIYIIICTDKYFIDNFSAKEDKYYNYIYDCFAWNVYNKILDITYAHGIDVMDYHNTERPLSTSSAILNITHTDHDGYFCSGILSSIIESADRIAYKPELKVITSSYNINYEKIEKVLTDNDDIEEVWITDLNLDLVTLKKLVAIKPYIRWYYVDHHNRRLVGDEYYSLIREFQKLFSSFVYIPSGVNGHTKSAAALMLDIVNRVSDCYINKRIVDYVSAWDTRTFTSDITKNNTFNMHYGLNAMCLNPTECFGLFNLRALLNISEDNEKDIDEIKDIGEHILKFKDVANEIYTLAYGFEFTLIDDDGKQYSGFAYNYIGDSYCFPDNIMNKYDICATFCVTGVSKAAQPQPRYKFTLYSNKDYVNCGRLCYQINKGGGHAGAAGFMAIDGLPFENVNDGENITLYLRTMKQREESTDGTVKAVKAVQGGESQETT